LSKLATDVPATPAVLLTADRELAVVSPPPVLPSSAPIGFTLTLWA
jgi:hypothetical protein